MTTAQVVEISVTVNNNSPIKDYIHPDDHIPPNFTKLLLISFLSHFKVINGECEDDLRQPSIHLLFKKADSALLVNNLSGHLYLGSTL